LIIILGIGNPTYTPMTDAKEEVLDNHRCDLCSFGISTKDEELDLPSLYKIPKLHNAILVVISARNVSYIIPTYKVTIHCAS
jgi:hypothetical protein